MKTVNEKLDDLAKEYDKGNLTAKEYLAAITKILRGGQVVKSPVS